MKKVFNTFVVALFLMLIGCIQENIQREPILINTFASEAELSINEIIDIADLIVIGEIVAIHPSRWSTPNGQLPDNATIEMVADNRWSIFTDSEFKISEYLKGETKSPIIRIRTFQGEVGIDKMTASDQPNYLINSKYLLFLFIDDGTTSSVSPGAYYGTSSPYQIIDNKAVSINDERNLDEFIQYIQDAISNP